MPPRIRNILFRENGCDGALGLARAAVDALVGVDVEHSLSLIDAIDWAHIHTRPVLHIDTWLGDDVRQLVAPETATVDSTWWTLSDRVGIVKARCQCGAGSRANGGPQRSLAR